MQRPRKGAKASGRRPPQRPVQVGQGSADWLVDGGELGELIRATDWSKTPLGPREDWPQSLRTVVNLMLGSRLPMALAWGPELLVLYNDAFRAIVADRHPRALGRPSRDIGADVWHINEPIFTAVMERGVSLDFEDKAYPIERNGHREEAHFTLCYSPVRLADGTVGGTLVTVQDTTVAFQHSRLLRESEERFSVIHDRAPFAIALTRVPGGEIVSANDAFLRMVELTREEAIGKRIVEICTADPESQAQVVERLRNHGSVPYLEVTHRMKSGDERILLLSVNRVAVAGQDHILSTVEDITERRRAEDALREANAQLAEAGRRKDEFLAMLSHELRNPLQPITNSLYILDHVVPGGEQALRAKAVIDRQVGHMIRLIDDLLDVTRITRGKALLKCERLDLNELTWRTIDDHRGAFVEGGIELQMSMDTSEVWVHGDRTRLTQVIGNLLQNSAKFTPRGGRTSVSVRADAARGQAMIRVQDTGRGIEPRLLPHLFEAFIQADVTLDRKKGGLGLGLALVKGMVEMHGGSVAAASDGVGKGATFTIVLPLAAAIPAETTRRSAEAGGSARRVLVIEDNVDAAESLREALELGDHEVEIAHSGPEGIEKARAFGPEVVLCDIGLPEMDGYEVAQAMRAEPELKRIKLVALTGYAGPGDVDRARKAGFDAHLAKPPTIDALQEVLQATGTGACAHAEPPAPS